MVTRLDLDNALAAEHIARGRAIVLRQREIIREIRDHEGDCSRAEELLATFERTLAAFEHSLGQLEKLEDR